MIGLEDLVGAVEGEVIGHARDVVDDHPAIASLPLDILLIHILDMVAEASGEHIMLGHVASAVQAVR